MCAVAAFVHPNAMSLPSVVALHPVGSATSVTVMYVAPKSLGGYVMNRDHPAPLRVVYASPLFAFAW